MPKGMSSSSAQSSSSGRISKNPKNARLRKKSIYSGHSLFGPGALVSKELANAKTLGYTSSKAVQNRWGIQQIDFNSSCLQCSPPIHEASLHLNNGSFVQCSMNGKQLRALAIHLKCTKFTPAHGGDMLKEYEVRKSDVKQICEMLDSLILKKRTDKNEPKK